MNSIKFTIATFSVAMILSGCDASYPEDDRDFICDERPRACNNTVPTTTTTRYVPPTSASICLKANSKPAPVKPKPVPKPAPIIIVPPREEETVTEAPPITTTTTETTETRKPVYTPEAPAASTKPGC